MRSMKWQLGILGTISAFAYRHKETEKNLCRDGRLCFYENVRRSNFFFFCGYKILTEGVFVTKPLSNAGISV